MSSFQRLPLEIIQQIIELLPHGSIYQCIFLCKSWHLPAIHEYYKELHVKSSNIEALHSSLFGTPDSTLKIFYGHLVKSLKIYEYSGARDIGRITDSQFSSLLLHLPSLEKIDLTSTNANHHEEYLTCLYQTDTISQHNLQHLHEIIIESNTTDFGKTMYFSAYYKFHKSLTHLTIYPSYKEVSFNGQSGDYLHYLPDFTNLTHIHLDGRPYKLAQDRYAIIYPVLKRCPNLISYSMKIDHGIYTTAEEEFLAAVENGQVSPVALGEDIEMPDDTQNNSSIQQASSTFSRPKKYHKCLEIADLKLPNLIKPYLLFFTSYISNHRLHTLKIHSERTIFQNWIADIGVDTVMDFAKYLGSIKNLYIHMGNRSYYYNGPILYLYADRHTEISLEDEMIRYWKFVGLIRGNRVSTIRHLRMKIREQERKDSRFGINIQNNNIKELKCGLGINRDDNANNGTYFMTHAIPTSEFASIDTLTLEIKYQNVDSNVIDVTQLLEYIVSNGSKLTSLVITKSNSRSTNFCQRKTIESKMGLLQTHTMTTSGDQEGNLAEICLAGVDVLQPAVSIINGPLCNSIKKLNLYGCKFSRNEYQNIVLDFSGLKLLEHLVFDTALLQLKRSSYFFFKFTTINTSNDHEEAVTYYYMFDKKSSKDGEIVYVPTTEHFINLYKRATSHNSTVVDITLASSENIAITLTDSLVYKTGIPRGTVVKLCNISH